jgi:hypothetical protein
MLRFLAVLSLALLAAVVGAGRRTRTGEYVGMDHPSGELRLRLEPDGHFTLKLAVWDAVVGDFVSQRELAGEWRMRWRGLELRAAGRRLVYSRAHVLGRGWIWQRSTLPTFADGVALLPERRAPSPRQDAAPAPVNRRRFS